MARERLKSPRERMFVALDLPGEVREGIDAWGRRELADPGLRRVAPESLHVTLAFLGHTPVRAMGRLEEILASAAGGAPGLRLGDPVPRPERGRPRLFALPADSPDTEELAAALRRDLVAARLYEPEKRPFWPHVTVARVRREQRGGSRPAVVERWPGKLPEALSRPFDGVRITLYRSELQPRGARYVPLAQVELPNGGRQ